VGAKVSLPAGYEMTWGGEFENQQRAMARLQLVIPVALLLTFLLLFSTFGKLFDSFIIMGVVPFALLGGVAGLAIVGMPLSVSAAVGFIALLGQAVLNECGSTTAKNWRARSCRARANACARC
jgi:cobalt-zinc-cadmium resistance protein CzcA